MSEPVELPTVEERCGTCRFFKQEEDDRETERGVCRRHPPTPNIIDNLAVLLNLRDISRESYQYSEDYYTPYDYVPLSDEEDGEAKPQGPHSLSFEADHLAVWPAVTEDGWCGEWQAKRPTPPAPPRTPASGPG